MLDPGNWMPVWSEGATNTATSSYQWFFLSSLIAHAVATNGWNRDCPSRSWPEQPPITCQNGFAGSLWLWSWACPDGDRFAEVIGSTPSAFFGWPCFASILITIFDVFLIGAHASRDSKDRGHRINLWSSQSLHFGYLVFYRNQISRNLRWLPAQRGARNWASKRNEALTWALKSSATVMPHNLYLLHSSISQTRKVDYKDPADIWPGIQILNWVWLLSSTLLLILERPLLQGTEIRLVL